MGVWSEGQPPVRKVRESLDRETHCVAVFVGWIEEENMDSCQPCPLKGMERGENPSNWWGGTGYSAWD